MDAFETVWETSRHNSWSFGYPTAICIGVASLIVLSFVRRSTLRRTSKCIAAFLSAFLAADFSAREIQEKWRIRGEWAETHQDQMTDAGWDALSADGANLVLGPLIYGFQATAIFVVVALALFVVRRSVSGAALQHASSNAPDADVAKTFPISSNPYSPPNRIN